NQKTAKEVVRIEQLISSALRDAHVARDKGSYTVSHDAIRAINATSYVGALTLIKSLPLDSCRISDFDSFPPLLFLSKNDNPKIRSEAKSVFTRLRNIMSGIHRDHVSSSSLEEQIS
ncbi:PREDICTED: uncharacterized protein LOC104822185, partial [Tarenaya hassleriana]|uniref:uncharacterized protein LOC104822185 n=1 Tax=Tarenaya hassleriana TaxID=28532 RepID=UPI00053CA30A